MSHRFLSGRFWGLVLLLLGALPGRAQLVNTVQFTVGTRGRPSAYVLPTAGGWLAPGTIQFGTDSNCVSLLRFDPALNITRSRQYRLSLPRTNYGPFVRTPSGLVFRGQVSGTDCLFSVDSTFAVRWGLQILPVGMSQGIGLGILVTDAPDRVTGYPILSVVSGATGFTRVWGSAATGTGWRGRMLTSTISNWRVSRALAPDASGIHYLTGDTGAPFIKLDTTKVYWSYLLSAGGTQDGIGTPKAAANGDLWVPMQSIPAGAQSSEIIISRYDTAGNLRWAQQLAQPSRFLGISDIFEMAGGDLLVAGYSRFSPGGKFQPMLFRFTATGTLVWAHRWNVGTQGPVGGVPSLMVLPGGGYRLFNSDLSFIDLDANFNGCQFVDETANITTRAATITATPLPLMMTPLAITTAPQAIRNRTFTYTRTLLCSAVGLAEDAAATSGGLAAWPQPLPRGTALQLMLPAGWSATDTRLTLTSALGQVVWQGPWAEAVMLPTHLPSGCWTLTATGRAGQRLHRRLLTE